jgi:tetratricopeptide (TPR) repeat protein/V8-like Glu-specific endopeptidase
MRYPIIFGIAATIALVQTHPARAKSSTEVAQVAKAITVMITTQGSIGSGVIIKHEGDTYTILTAAHVVKSKSETYTLTTADGKQHQLNNATIKKLPKSIDLAIVKFTSTNTYPIAKIGSSSQALEGSTVYAAGFPAPTRAITQSVYAFKDGKVIANSSRDLEGGYGIVYSCNTLPGMSGGGIFNDNGELIAIHGKGDVDEKYKPSQENENIRFKTGNDLGIPIDTFMRLASNVGVNTGIEPPAVVANTAPTASDFFVSGVVKLKKGDNQGALTDFNQSISIDPNFVKAYHSRGMARYRLGDKRGAFNDYDRAIQLNQSNFNYAYTYGNRASARNDLGDKRGAITDYNRAIQLDSNYAWFYSKLGIVYFDLGDYRTAIANFDRAIQLDPDYERVYTNRCGARIKLEDNRAAIPDCDRAIQLNPNNAAAYYMRGLLYARLGDREKGLIDTQKAAILSEQQGDRETYQLSIALIQKIQAVNSAQQPKAIQPPPTEIKINLTNILLRDVLRIGK